MQLTGPRVIATVMAATAPILVEVLARQAYPDVLEARGFLTFFDVVVTVAFGAGVWIDEDGRHRLPPAREFGAATVERPSFRASSVRRLVSLAALLLAPVGAWQLGKAFPAVALPAGAACVLVLAGSFLVATPTRWELRRAQREWLALAHAREWIAEHTASRRGWPPRLLGEVGGVPVVIELRRDPAYPPGSRQLEDSGGLFTDVYTTVVSIGGSSSPVVHVCWDGVVGVGLERAVLDAVKRVAGVEGKASSGRGQAAPGRPKGTG